MRVLFVHEKCGYFGGVEQNIALTARGLTRRGHDCYLAYGERTDKEPDPYGALFRGAVAAAGLSSSDETRATPFAEPFVRVFSDIKPDAVYVHKIPNIDVVRALVGRARIVRMVHDHDLCCPRRHKYFAYSGKVCNEPAGLRCYLDAAFVERDRKSRLGLKLVSINDKLGEMRKNRSLDALLVGSRFMQNELLYNDFPRARVHIVPPAVLPGEIALSEVPREPRILYVGQLIRGKGVDLLLRALALVKTPFIATLVGTGNAEPGLRALAAELGLGDRVTFAGWVANAELSPLYRACRVAVVPSRWPEPFGMVGLEAMLHGRAVVGFAAGGIPDWLEDGKTGLLVPEQDESALATSLTRVLSDYDLAARMGAEAYARVRARFGFETFLDQVEGHLMNTPPGGR